MKERYRRNLKTLGFRELGGVEMARPLHRRDVHHDERRRGLGLLQGRPPHTAEF